MRKILALCVSVVVIYKCDSHHVPVLGGIISGASDIGSQVQGVLEGLASGLNLQGHLEINTQKGNYNPQTSSTAGYRPENTPETIIVVVEETPGQNEFRPPGQYGHRPPQQSGYGYRPSNNNYNQGNKPGYGNYGGNYNHGPWNSGYNNHNRPHHHHRPGYGYNPHSHYNGNNNGYNHNNGNFYGNPSNPKIERPNNDNYNGNQNPFESGPITPPNNNNNVNHEQKPNDSIPTNLPFDKPINGNNDAHKPTIPSNRPFDRPINENSNGIPTIPLPQGSYKDEIEKQNNQKLSTNRPQTKPQYGTVYEQNEENIVDKKPVFSSTVNTINDIEKATKKPEDDDKPLFVPLNPEQYVYGGDKIEINAPKRETPKSKPEASIDYSDSDIDPLDIRIGERQNKE